MIEECHATQCMDSSGPIVAVGGLGVPPEEYDHLPDRWGHQTVQLFDLQRDGWAQQGPIAVNVPDADFHFYTGTNMRLSDDGRHVWVASDDYGCYMWSMPPGVVPADEEPVDLVPNGDVRRPFDCYDEYAEDFAHPSADIRDTVFALSSVYFGEPAFAAKVVLHVL